ncbi:hypothetical protein [Flavobacterium pedocola]
MKNKLYLLLLLILTNLTYAQNNFEKGYYIDNGGNKIEGYIKNLDWAYNPVSFEFKTTEAEIAKTLTINFVTEFSIEDVCKYIRVDIDIERSNTDNVTLSKEPKFSNERLFLREIVSGKAMLYKYVDSSITRYFFSVDNSPIKQLLNIPYYADKETLKNNPFMLPGSIIHSETYKRQLWMSVKNEKTTQKRVEKLTYSEDSLEPYFKEYNGATNEGTDKEKKASYRKNNYTFNIKGGAIFNSSKIDFHRKSGSVNQNFNFKDNNFTLGVEFELIFPFNNKKWALILEPSFHNFKDETEYNDGIVTTKYTADVRYVEIPFGFRHYFFLNDNSKIFANVIASVRDFSPKSQVAAREIKSSNFFPGIGFGYNYKKASCEFRYYFNNNMAPHSIYTTNASNFHLALRYEVLSTKKKELKN